MIYGVMLATRTSGGGYLFTYLYIIEDFDSFNNFQMFVFGGELIGKMSAYKWFPVSKSGGQCSRATTSGSWTFVFITEVRDIHLSA